MSGSGKLSGLCLLILPFVTSPAHLRASVCDEGHCDDDAMRVTRRQVSGGSCESHFCRDWWTRPTATGDWCGVRPCLQESGVSFRGTATQFAFGVEGGINNLAVPPPLGQGDTFKYTGRGEYDLIVDLEKVLRLPRGQLLIGMQHWWGQFGNVSFNTGALVPAVLSAIAPPTPNNPGQLFLTEFLCSLSHCQNRLVAIRRQEECAWSGRSRYLRRR